MAENLDVVTKTYDLTLWLLPRVAKFPRSQRYTLGQRMETEVLDILGQLVEAQYRGKKLTILYDTNIKLERLRFLVRLAKDLNLMSVRQYEFSATAIDEVGVLLGGWIKQQQQRK